MYVHKASSSSVIHLGLVMERDDRSRLSAYWSESNTSRVSLQEIVYQLRNFSQELEQHVNNMSKNYLISSNE